MTNALNRERTHKQRGIPKRIVAVVANTIVSLACTYVFYITLHTLIDRVHPALNKNNDFQLSDLSFAYGQMPLGEDDNIVIANCNGDNRQGIADKIHKLDSAGAKVIGVDITFLAEYATSDSGKLYKELREHESKLILVKNYNRDYQPHEIDEQLYKFDFRYGYISFDKNKYATRRLFEPSYILTGYNIPVFSFPVAVYQKYTGYSDKVILETIGNHRIINYRRAVDNSHRYKIINSSAEITREDIYGKIVLLGGIDTSSILDMHFTPLNRSMGKSFPDMSGVEHHAQVISMLINKDFVTELPRGVYLIMIFIFTFILFVIKGFFHSKERTKPFAHFISEIIVCVFALLLIVISGVMLEYFKVRLEPVSIVVPVFVSLLFDEVIHLFIKSHKH